MWQYLFGTNDLVVERIYVSTPTRESMMCMTRHLSWVLGDWSCTLDLTTKFTGGLCWDPFPYSICPYQVAVAPFGDWVPVDDIYWCSVPGWAALFLARVTGCQFTAAWWSQQWPPEGNNCVVINVTISLLRTDFCFALCVSVWTHGWCNNCNKHILLDLTWQLWQWSYTRLGCVYSSTRTNACQPSFSVNMECSLLLPSSPNKGS